MISELFDKKYSKIIFCLVCSLVFVAVLLYPGLVGVDDTIFHVNRLQGIVNAFEDGQILTKIYPYSNNAYGYPLSLFYCDIFLYPFAFIYKLGVPLVISYKIMICFYSMLSVFSIMYFSSKIFVNNSTASYISTALYTFNSYHITDVYLRGAVGEILSFVFVPFVIYEMYLIFIKQEDHFISLGISFALLVLCHNLTFLIYCFYFLLFYIAFVIINIKNRKIILKQTISIFKAIGIAILLSAFYIFPLIEQLIDKDLFMNKYGFYAFGISKDINIIKYFVESFNSIYINERNNIGFVLLLSPILYIFCKKKNIYMTIIYVIILYFGYCFVSGIPSFLDYIDYIGVIQFRWRINVILFPLLSLCSAYCFINLDNVIIKKIFLFMIFVSVILNETFLILNYKNTSIERYQNNATHHDIFDIKLMEGDIRKFNVLELSGGEYLPDIDFDYLHSGAYICKADGYNIEEIQDDKGEYLSYDRYGTHISFEYSFENQEQITVPLTYYKGYSGYAVMKNGEKIDLDVKRDMIRGLVSFKGINGAEKYCVQYTGTSAQNISLIASLLTWLSISIIKIIAIIKKNNYLKS